MLRNILEERKPHLHLGDSLKSASKSQEFVDVYLISAYVFIEWCLMKQGDSFTY
jgi:hypothetical protein